MKLHCEQLESLSPPVGLEIVPLLGIESHPLYGEAVAAIVQMADRLQSPLPEVVQPYTAFHGWGVDVGRPVPANTLRVYVGPAGGGGEYGSAAPGGWQSETPLPRSWGGWIGLDLDAVRRDGVDVGTVARHEFGHAVGLPHLPAPSLMQPNLPPGTARDLTYSDADALDALGFDAVPLTHMPGMVRVYGVGTTPNGWMMVPSDDADTLFHEYVRVPDGGGHSWALAPTFSANLIPL